MESILERKVEQTGVLLEVMREAQSQLEQRQQKAAERRERLLKLAMQDYEKVVQQVEDEYAEEMGKIYAEVKDYVLEYAREVSETQDS